MPQINDRCPTSGLVSPREAFIVFLACAATFSVINVALGKDLNWDFFNYHRYAALNIYQSRIQQDFFAAGYQGYMNPIAYAPFAWMIHAQWHSLMIGCILACLHSLNAFFLYLICREILTRNNFPRITAALSTTLGCASGAVISQIGSTFVDPLTTVPIMAGLWLLISNRLRFNADIACGLGGFSVALKLTNAPYAIGLFLALLGRSLIERNNWREIGLSSLGALICGTGGFLITYAPWGFGLWESYGSPIFPLFNGIFKAPDFPSYNIALDRFVPQHLVDSLMLPFRMLSSESWVYTEIQAPDIRPTVILAGLAAWGSLVALRRQWDSKRCDIDAAHSSKSLAALVFFLAALPLWIVTSSNGRYAIPLLLLMGPFLVLVWQNAFGENKGRILLGTCIVVQVAAIFMAGFPRWSPMPWTKTWLPASIPRELKESPYLYITLGLSSESYLAAEVHPQSIFVNPIGLLSISTGGPGWNRFTFLRDTHKGATQIVLPPANISDPEARHIFIRRHNAMINRLGLVMDEMSCRSVIFNDSREAISSPWIPPVSPQRELLICSAQTAPVDQELDQQRRMAESIMNKLEDRCPKIFQPRRPQIEGDGINWVRLYGKHDLIVSLDFGKNRTLRYRQDRQGIQTVIGSVDNYSEDIDRFVCRLPHDGSRGIETLRPDESH